MDRSRVKLYKQDTDPIEVLAVDVERLLKNGWTRTPFKLSVKKSTSHEKTNVTLSKEDK